MTLSALEPITFTHVSGISWPRSGHQLLVRLLTGYFGPQCVYCEFHNVPPSDRTLGACCKQVPCARRDRVALTKNHDFALDVPQIAGHRYLVQYRAFAPSVVSNFELAVRNGLADTPEAFRGFVSGQFTGYLGFTDRWVHAAFAQTPEVLLLPYETLLASPVHSLMQAVRHLAPEHTPDAARARAVVATVDGQRVADRKVQRLAGTGVHKSRDVRDFRYYDPGLFATIDALRLSREAVIACFQAHMGRAPDEAALLRLQTCASTEALTELLRDSPEYRLRHPAAQNSVPDSVPDVPPGVSDVSDVSRDALHDDAAAAHSPLGKAP